MTRRQGYVHVNAPDGQGQLTMTHNTDAHQCAVCGVSGGDMLVASVPGWHGERIPVAAHLSCLDSLMYVYRTGRAPGRGRVTE